MYYIDIVILLIIIIIIVLIVYDIYKKNIKIIKKIKMYTEFDYHKLGSIKFFNKDNSNEVFDYFSSDNG